jgi:hypothetical protein
MLAAEKVEQHAHLLRVVHAGAQAKVATERTVEDPRAVRPAAGAAR